MNELPVPRPSPCPGLLRIVQALDGGICRIKLPGGVLTGVQARAIAEAAERHASGVLELTNRSNLQIRGVRPDAERALIRELLAAGLGPSMPDADDVRNLMLSPAADLDRQQHMDTRLLAADLLALLQNNPALHDLSAYRCLLVVPMRLAARLQQTDAFPRVRLSGCSRSNLAAHVAPLSVVRVHSGRGRCGELLASPMTIDQAGVWLAQHHATGRTHA